MHEFTVGVTPQPVAVSIDHQLVYAGQLAEDPAVAEERRRGRVQALSRMAPAHPAFRWQVNGALLAHRRADEGVTSCDRRGELTVVVDPDVPPCPKCYPS